MSNCNLDFDFCEHCIYGKQNRVIFPSSATREKGILELIYNDVSRPMHVPSLGKSVYYVSFIDDSQGTRGFIFIERNMRYLINLKSLRLW
jgi:hypothetical protein